jgi:hypothetical protein
LVGPVFGVVVCVLVDDEAQVPLSGDQDAAGGLAPAGSDPALSDRVHPGDAGQDGPHAGADCGEDRVKGLGEIVGVVADQVPDAGGVRVVQRHHEIAGLLGCSFDGDVPGDVGDVHPPGAVLDEEEDEQPSQEHGVHLPPGEPFAQVARNRRTADLIDSAQLTIQDGRHLPGRLGTAREATPGPARAPWNASTQR